MTLVIINIRFAFYVKIRLMSTTIHSIFLFQLGRVVSTILCHTISNNYSAIYKWDFFIDLLGENSETFDTTINKKAYFFI